MPLNLGVLRVSDGEVIKGIEVVDKIAAVQTSKGADRDRPIEDVRIVKAKLVKRKKNR